MNAVIRSGFCRLTTLALVVLAAASGLWRAGASDGKGSGTGLPQVQTINKEIAAGWKRDPGDASKDLTPSRQATDYEFIRRATLDIIGRIATPEEIRRFLRDPQPVRRSLLIDRLLQGPEYAKNWAGIWSVWLMTRSGPELYHEEMRSWLEGQFAKPDQGFDKIVTELLTATGKTTENGAVNFLLSQLGEPVPQSKRNDEGQFSMVPITSRTTRLFLGLQIQCTQCHDHPFNSQWKQQHFWGVNAFFRQVERKGAIPKRNAPPATFELTDNESWNSDTVVFFEKRNGVVLPARATFLDGERMTSKPNVTRRQELADFIVRNEYFAKALVNRMWGHFFGRGMNYPGAVDDFGDHNPVTHPKLLDYLAKEFRDYGCNSRELIRWICNSTPYGLSSVANKTNDKVEAEPYCSRMLLKAMTPEQLFESLIVATQTEAGESAEDRKKRREAWMKNLIVNFGDDEGNEVTFNGTVVQALMLMNGREINEAVTQKEKGTVIDALKRRGATVRTVTDDIYLAALNRSPIPAEQQEILRKLPMRVRDRDIAAPWQDLLWALINSSEFLLNH
jgi:Protein of unknown function (DUF1549)/Protein of unknown function (DUF1553)